MRTRPSYCVGLAISVLSALLLWSTLATAATTAGNPWSWGYNAYGQLGGWDQ